MTVSDGIEANSFEIENVGMKASQRERKALYVHCVHQGNMKCAMYMFSFRRGKGIADLCHH